MDGKQIINVAYCRDPVENSAYNGDVVTAKALSDFRKYLLDEVLLRNSDNVMDGRLEMSGYKIKGLGNPVSQFILPSLDRLPPGGQASHGWLDPRGATCPGISYPPPWLSSPPGGNISRLVYLAPPGGVKLNQPGYLAPHP